MNNQLATKTANGRISTHTSTSADDLIATLPKWLAYLVGAFPAANVNKMTFLAYETAFAETDPALMLAAVQMVTKQHKFASFPTIAEINQAVAAATEQAYQAERQAVAVYRSVGLARKELLDAAYRGEIDPAAWQRFISDCQAQEYESNASWARRKLAQFQAAGHAT